MTPPAITPVGELNTAISGSAKYQPTGLSLRENLPFEEWESIGTTLSTIENGVNWWIGDWLNYGERQYGETYAQAVQETGRKYKSLANYAWVAGRIEVSRRRENLPWSHHETVASLDPAVQDRLLDDAERNRWSRDKLREAVQELKRAIAPGGKPAYPTTDDMPPRGGKVEEAPATEKGLFADANEGEEAHPPVEEADSLVAAPGQKAVPLDIYEEADRQIRHLQEVVSSLTSDDQAAAVVEWSTKYRQLEGRLRDEARQRAEAARTARYYRERMQEIRKVLGVGRDEEVIAALLELKQGRAA